MKSTQSKRWWLWCTALLLAGGGAWLYFRGRPAETGSHPAVALPVPTDRAATAALGQSAAPPASAPAVSGVAPVVSGVAPAPAAPAPQIVVPGMRPGTAAAARPASVSPAIPRLPPPRVDETEATRRMYGAHAPLRTPAVADPDSAANRQILQTMVTKALRSQPGQPQ